ncbi:hypothetical protein NHF39_23510 [Pseudomonas proteolytica]|nr:hypothetical protein [Pseudomonas proteolytica]USW94267.1 hypothetical protein NHF39_23510 [Pseudomonas proteolytica]USX01762.1 hypothetical protein NHF41_08055 [Pseudomonas proteolytica]
MTAVLPNVYSTFFNAGLVVDSVSQHIEAQINQKNAPAPTQPELPSFPFNGTEYRARPSNPTLIPTPRIG